MLLLVIDYCICIPYLSKVLYSISFRLLDFVYTLVYRYSMFVHYKVLTSSLKTAFKHYSIMCRLLHVMVLIAKIPLLYDTAFSCHLRKNLVVYQFISITPCTSITFRAHHNNVLKYYILL